MNTLSENWFMEGRPDRELKEYILLAYLQQVEDAFQLEKLYPQLGELIFHYRNLEHFSRHKKMMEKDFPHELKEIDLKNYRLKYEAVVEDSELMQEITAIVTRGMALMRDVIDEGIDTGEKLMKKIKIQPVGIEPIYKKEGFLLIRNDGIPETLVYSYSISSLTMHDTPWRSIQTGYVKTYAQHLINYPEKIKQEILREHPTFPNPCTFYVETSQYVPFLESLLPLVKRKLFQIIQL